MPASFVFFDLLCEGDRDLRTTPFGERRGSSSRCSQTPTPPLHLTPATRDRATAARLVPALRGRRPRRRHGEAGAGPTSPNKRVMLKVKHERECDCVVAGFRWHKQRQERRSDRCSSASTTTPAACSTSACARASPTRSAASWWTFLAPYRENALDGSSVADWAWRSRRRGGGAAPARRSSRWSQGKDLSWEPLRPELVVEVAYDHMQRDALPAHGAVPPLAPRQAAERLHVRSAGGRAAAGAGRDLRDRTLASRATLRAFASRHSRVGSSSGSGVSCGGRSPPERCAG